MDNAASHPREVELENIKIIWLPPNTTSVCQPLDQGVIRAFKFHYRSFIVKNILANLETHSDSSKKYNILESIFFVEAAWKKVSIETIQNCFRKAGFDKDIYDSIEFDEEDDCIPLIDLQMLIRGCGSILPEEYLSIDQNINTEDDSIIVEIENTDSEIDPEEVSDSENWVEVPHKVTNTTEALKYLHNVKQFLQTDFKAFNYLKQLESHLQDRVVNEKQANLRQKYIKDFFATNKN